jgi:hypothetical protein
MYTKKTTIVTIIFLKKLFRKTFPRQISLVGDFLFNGKNKSVFWVF